MNGFQHVVIDGFGMFAVYDHLAVGRQVIEGKNDAGFVQERNVLAQFQVNDFFSRVLHLLEEIRRPVIGAQNIEHRYALCLSGIALYKVLVW